MLYNIRMDIISRQNAKSLGLRRYFTGKPCLRGHIVARWTISGLCTQCGNDHFLARQKAKREEFTQRQKAWRQANLDHSREYFRQWRRENQERATLFSRRWRLSNPEAHAEAGRQWCKNNPVKRLAIAARYRARLVSAPGSFTEDDIERLLEQQGYHCNGCGTDLLRRFHVDHIIPLSRHGTNWPDNLQCLCHPCNTSKGDKTMDEWLTARAPR
jgi:5-methylcytosine-specific restriction endonuclease McrA